MVPRAIEGALRVLSGVSNRVAEVLSTDGCLEPPVNELLSLPVALEYLKFGEFLCEHTFNIGAVYLKIYHLSP